VETNILKQAKFVTMETLEQETDVQQLVQKKLLLNAQQII